MPEWKKKYLMMVQERDYWVNESKRLEQTIQELRTLCNEQQDELRAMKYKHP